MRIGHASKNEKSQYTGGQAGDQTNLEVCIREWYNNNWNVMLRAKDPNKAEIMAQSCEKGCINNNVGYDQNTRNTLHTQAIKVNFDLSKVGLCNCDCSSFMSVCAESAGIAIPYKFGNAPTTSTMKTDFLSTGEFDLYTDKIYLNNYNFLKRGDILIKEGSHTVMVLDNGTLANNVVNIKCIDISSVQGDIDFAQVRASGIQRIILRSTVKGNKADTRFQEYLYNCEKYGFDTECYKYSYALSVDDAIKEANSVIKLLEDKRVRIWLDLEYSTQISVIGKVGILNVANAFLKTCENAGFEVGIYCNLNWYNNYIDKSLKDKYKFWIARYGKNDGQYDMMYKPNVGEIGWQYTSKGSVRGIKGFVDLDMFYDTIKENTSPNEPNKPIKNDINICNTVNANSLNVRKYPNKTSAILYKLNRNEKVTIYGYVKDWYTIDKNLNEWVNKDYIVTAKGKVNANKLNYRQNVGTNSKLLGQYNNGEIVNILNKKNDGNTTWYLCLGNNDKFGWVSGDYILPV